METERWELASGRIAQIAEDPEIRGCFGDYFKKTAEFLMLMLDAWDRAGSGWLAAASMEELEEWNLRLYGELLPEHYGESYANPAFAVRRRGGGTSASYFCYAT